MVKFGLTSISNGTLEVTGPADPEPGMEIKHLRFMITQGDVMVEDDADVADGGWTGETPAGGIQAGPAHGIGLAVMFKAGPPGSFETLTWVEPLTVT